MTETTLNRILIVDDDSAISLILGTFFKKNGYAVESATDGEEGWSKICEGDVDVVLSDYMMPRVDGMELLTRVRGHEDPRIRDTYFIMLTAKTDSEAVVEGLDRGVDDYIGKPFQHEEIRARVDAGLRLTETRDRLREAVTKKDELLGIVAHDLRNPISVISSVTELFELGELGELTGEVRNMVSMIRSSVETLLELINDLVDLSAIESGALSFDLEEVPASEIVMSEFRKFSPQADAKSITLTADAIAALNVTADLRRTRGVLANLLSNAIKYSNPGSRVEISVSESGGHARFAVADNGQGIPEDELDMLFTKFSRISTRPTGGESSSGLGLAICKSVIETMGGRIGADSEVGSGSTFWFELPLHAG